MSRQSPPDDDDLQHLYNEVWAGFLDEPSSAVTKSDSASSAGELESFYGAYGADEDPTKQAGRTFRSSTSTCA
jgi:hypothetical protein